MESKETCAHYLYRRTCKICTPSTQALLHPSDATGILPMCVTMLAICENGVRECDGCGKPSDRFIVLGANSPAEHENQYICQSCITECDERRGTVVRRIMPGIECLRGPTARKRGREFL